MITASLLALAVLWIAVLYRYPAYFVPRRPLGSAQAGFNSEENWIEVLPSSRHHEAPVLQEVG